MRLLQNGLVETDCGAVVPPQTPATIQDLLCLQKFINQALAQTSFPGFFRGGGGGGGPAGGGGTGSRGPQGPQGIQGPPGPINQIQDEGVDLPVESALNFIGSGVSAVDNPVAGSTDITIEDIYAATRIVSSEPAEGTDLTIQAAIDNLPTEGGLIFVKEGTYTIAAPIALSDKSIIIVGAGDATVIDVGVNAISAFTIPVLTAMREIVFKDFKAIGGSVAGQILFQNNDTSGLISMLAENIRASGFETILDTDYDTTYTFISRFDFTRCFFEPTASANCTLIETSNPANTYAGTIEANYYDCWMTGGSNNFFWNVDGDVYFERCEVSVKAGSQSNGLATNGSGFLMPNGDVTVFGSGGLTPETISDSYFNNFPTFGTSSRLVLRGAFTHVENSWFDGMQVQLVAADKVKVNGSHFRPDLSGIGAGSAPFGLDVDSTSIRNLITGCFFDTATTACIRLNGSTRNSITGCEFLSTLVRNTILEVGAADFNLGVGNIGLSTGGGMTIVGANSKFVIGDYNFA
jgi:hypothetical protein